MNYLRKLPVVFLALFLTTSLTVFAEEHAPAPHPDLSTLPCPPDPGLGPEVAAQRFLYAFTRLDQACFDAMWAEEATVFLPRIIGDSGPGRLDGREAILATFDAFFGDREASEEDVLGIVPQSFMTDQVDDVALVTFMLGPTLDNRRTFVFRRESDGWRIWHLHASRLRDFDAMLEEEVRKRIAEMPDSD